jgi:predicted nucleotidyltransferase
VGAEGAEGAELPLPRAAAAAVRSVLDAFAERFPGRLRAAYVEGSHADATPVPTSDVDLLLVVRGNFRGAGERRAATALLAWRAGVYVARKRDCHALGARHIGDEHGRLLADLYERCRGAWHS